MAPRTAGVLLHPTSLPSPFGVGDFGPDALRWIDTLAAMKQSWWQILPLGPTGAGDSPYQSFSAFAGNINLLSPELLEKDGLADRGFWYGRPFHADRFDGGSVSPFKADLLRHCHDRFRSGAAPHLKAEFEAYIGREKAWLHGYALFMAIRASLGGANLATWPLDLRRRNPVAIAALEATLGNEIRLHQFGQFLFDRQWTAVKAYAHAKQIRIIGDVPIFVSPDSADVWMHPTQFLVDANLVPTVVAGVPPDYFAVDGQHWGNPLYDWAAMATDDYAWWTARVRQTLQQVDLIRLDHFRGFAQAWHIPAAETTARNGTWVDGPQHHFFAQLRHNLGSLPFIAEDLGVITPDVDELRLAFGLPGMKVLQFGFDRPGNPHLPHFHTPHAVAYTGTHDNNTSLGWWQHLPPHEQQFVGFYAGHWIEEPHWTLTRLAWGSVANLAVVPWQDILGLGDEARMNVPGVATGNWGWRFRWDQVPPNAVPRLAQMTERYARDPGAEGGA